MGDGNAAHVLAALLSYKGYATSLYCPFGNEAKWIAAGLEEQGGAMIAYFADHNSPVGKVRGTPTAVSKHTADVIPGADVIVIPLPSFAYPSTLEGIKVNSLESWPVPTMYVPISF